MTSYRADLGAAHGRISQLETELDDSQRAVARLEGRAVAPTPAPTDSVAKEAATPTPAWWHAWPLAALAVLVVVYAVRFGAAWPALTITGPFDRLSVASAILSAALLSIAFVLRGRSGARSSRAIAFRLVSVLGYAVGAPFAIVVGIIAFEIVTNVLILVAVAGGVVFGLWQLFRWIRTGDEGAASDP